MLHPTFWANVAAIDDPASQMAGAGMDDDDWSGARKTQDTDNFLCHGRRCES
jgi:hypothetical protein